MNTAHNLKNVLADTYALMLKTHMYHWNVTGIHFKEMHSLFEDQYTNLFAAVDRIAERIRALGEFAPGGFKAFSELTFIQEPKDDISAHDMLIDLLSDHRKLVVQLKQGIKIANQYDDDATANMLTERIEVHEKQIWMIQSFMVDDANEGIRNHDKTASTKARLCC